MEFLIFVILVAFFFYPKRKGASEKVKKFSEFQETIQKQIKATPQYSNLSKKIEMQTRTLTPQTRQLQRQARQVRRSGASLPISKRISSEREGSNSTESDAVDRASQRKSENLIKDQKAIAAIKRARALRRGAMERAETAAGDQSGQEVTNQNRSRRYDWGEGPQSEILTGNRLLIGVGFVLIVLYIGSKLA